MSKHFGSLKFLVALFLIVSVMGVVFGSQKVDAAWGPLYYGRVLGYTYYSNQFQTEARFMFERGIPENTWNTTPTTANSFIASVESYLADDTNPEQVSAHASVLINAMMGIDGDDPKYDTPAGNPRWQNGIAVARANLPAWEAMVRAYDNGSIPGASVNWNDVQSFTTGTIDTFGGGGITPSSNFKPDTVTFDINASTEKVVTFYHANGKVFTIKKICGNLTGPEEPFPNIVPPIPPVIPPVVPQTQPYFQATGGDVIAGASFTTDTVTSCDDALHVTKAGIASWNSNGPPDFAGAGTQYAARAFSIIQGFATNQPAATAAEAASLSFANIPTPTPTTGIFGGLFMDGPCVDYWGQRPNLTAPSVGTIGNDPVMSNLDGTYYSPTNLELDGGVIQTGKHVTIYVQGDVAIKNPITYASGPWLDRTSIPSFRLIVLGSIFIGKSVPQLDGLYVAVPRAGEATTKINTYGAPIAGTISTCSTGKFTSYNPPVDMPAGNLIDTVCSTPLTVNGSMVAQQIWMLRSAGSLTGAPAETINYRPELWLSYPSFGSMKSDSSYQSISGLPPQL